MITYKEISPSEFFYQHRELAGFSNPSRALYSAVRELVENALDACDSYGIFPEVLVRLKEAYPSPSDIKEFELYVRDNGIGMPPDKLPNALGKVFYGSKFVQKQTRGTFGLGGTMSILYGQITTNKPLRVWSSTGSGEAHYFEMMIDVQKNRPIILKHKRIESQWRGTAIKINLVGDYARSSQKIKEYFRRLALFTPYADLVFEDPNGEVLAFRRTVERMPNPPREVLPHPKGVDAELLRRVIKSSRRSKTLLGVLMRNFQRMGRKTALSVLQLAGIDPDAPPSKVDLEQIRRLADAIKLYDKFLPPDSSCLSPLGEELIEEGIRSELNPPFVYAVTRKPTSYEGYPFIVEAAAVADRTQGIKLYRYANRIPLLYDEKSDVVWKILTEDIDLKRYRVGDDEPLIILTHVCSTKVPYKTMGKEYIADIPEVEKELKLALQQVLRKYSEYVGKRMKMETQKRRKNVYAKYLPLIAKFAAMLSDQKVPDVSALINSVEEVGLE
ncbi:MAG: DNA topoisomerase VI subunit B [Nitrososphaeria archaeon]